jgi:hypothetical protein
MCEEKVWGASKRREIFTQRQSITSPETWNFIVTAEGTSSIEGETCFEYVSRIHILCKRLFTAPVRRKAGVCSLGSNSVIMTAAFSCCKIWESQRWREQVSPKPRWYLKDHDFIQQNTWVLTFLQMFVEFIAFYYILSILTYEVPPKQIILVATVYAKWSECVDHSQALKYMYSKAWERSTRPILKSCVLKPKKGLHNRYI